MKLKSTRPYLREWFRVLIGPAIWLALLLLVASGNAYPAEAGAEHERRPIETRAPADASANGQCVEIRWDARATRF